MLYLEKMFEDFLLFYLFELEKSRNSVELNMAKMMNYWDYKLYDKMLAAYVS
jgi:hypothetical protein